jgi:hypothetical protein
MNIKCWVIIGIFLPLVCVAWVEMYIPFWEKMHRSLEYSDSIFVWDIISTKTIEKHEDNWNVNARGLYNVEYKVDIKKVYRWKYDVWDNQSIIWHSYDASTLMVWSICKTSLLTWDNYLFMFAWNDPCFLLHTSVFQSSDRKPYWFQLFLSRFWVTGIIYMRLWWFVKIAWLIFLFSFLLKKIIRYKK